MLFDDQTNDGNDMAYYYDLVAKSVVSIGKAFQEKVIENLNNDWGLIPIVTEQIKNTDDFTLVTWLVIKEIGEL